VQIDPQSIQTLADFVKAQKDQAEAQAQLKSLAAADRKQKLEHFKQTQDQLRENLRAQFDKKTWTPLEKILSGTDKGGIGIYVLYNETKNKYYVGQAKQIFKRIRDHFCIEDIARDFIAGDNITATFLTANELDADYRMDHVERLGIEIFDSEKNGYNKRQGSI
jgi:predicted GIY-YIG superfamily endonuclease